MKALDNLKIAIFGASSQVGSSLAFYLKHFTTHDVTCFIRSGYSSIFFDLSNIKTINVDINDTIQLSASIIDIDLVLDFTYPTGQLYELPSLIKKNLENILSATPPSATYIYMSSIHAIGMPWDTKELKRYYFPRTSYGYIKRKAEKHVISFGKKYSINTYTLRLGQVHGFLQSVSETFRQKLSSIPVVYLNGNEKDLTNTIFISSLADAVIKCANGKVRNNMYTVIAYPQWTLAELYGYYKKFFSLNTEINYKPDNGVTTKTAKSYLVNKLKKYRPFFENYILLKSPDLSLKLKGKYRVIETATANGDQKISYSDLDYIGTPSDELIKDLDCSVESVFEREKLMQEKYFMLLKANTK